MLSPLSRESNYKDSLKKFFVDMLSTENVPVSFDKMVNFPDIYQEAFRITDERVDRWVFVTAGNIYQRTPFIEAYPSIFVCARRDNEGYKLAQLRDYILGKISIGMAIPFYRSYPDPVEWELLTQMTVYHQGETAQLTTKEGTKFKEISLELKWAAML
jgi:hypothetical protein